MSTSMRVGLGVLALAACSFAWACSATTSSADVAASPNGGQDERNAGTGSVGSSSGGQPAPADLGPTDNAVILVHAAEALPYRLCFSGLPKLQPQPDAQAMPQANVVGVEVGNAVRLAPLPGVPLKVWLFEEPLIRNQYFNPLSGSKGPECGQLLSTQNSAKIAIELGDITTDLSKGVHLLVVKGCAADAPLAKHTKERCGADWTPEKGNLKIQETTLTARYRNDPKTLPTQVINLSQSLESARAGRDVTISYGDLSSPSGAEVAKNPGLFKDAAPENPVILPFDPEDQTKFSTTGFRIGVPEAAGAPKIDVAWSLADLQKLSAPSDVPSSYYAVGSSYVLLLLGNPAAKLEDGGVDNDPRRALHFLVVPIVEPKPDAGSDATTATP